MYCKYVSSMLYSARNTGKESGMKRAVFALLVLAISGFAAERVVLWEFFTGVN